jgi:hypothetical protein
VNIKTFGPTFNCILKFPCESKINFNALGCIFDFLGVEVNFTGSVSDET